jgi:MSHA biogenesis protein MshJ
MTQARKQLGKSWTRMASWIDSRTLSQRALLFAAIVALLVVVLNQIFLHAASVRIAVQSKQMASDRAATRKLQAEINKLAAEVVVDPDAANKQRLQKLLADEKAVKGAIEQSSQNLVAPDQMISMLDAIMARQDKLQLISLAKLPIQSVSTATPAVAVMASQPAGAAPVAPVAAPVPPAQANDVVYKPGVEIVVEGGYPELMDYLAQLEKLPVRVIWGNLKLRVDGYPKTTMSLTIYTLSLEKKWLNI